MGMLARLVPNPLALAGPPDASLEIENDEIIRLVIPLTASRPKGVPALGVEGLLELCSPVVVNVHAAAVPDESPVTIRLPSGSQVMARIGARCNPTRSIERIIRFSGFPEIW